MVSKVDFYIFWRKYVRVCLSKTHYHVSCLCVQSDVLHIAMWLLAGPSQKCFYKWVILFCFSVMYVVFVLSSSRNCRSDCLKRIVRGFLFLKKTVHLNCSNTSQYYVCLFFNCICHLINAALVSMRIFSKTLQNGNYFNFWPAVYSITDAYFSVWLICMLSSDWQSICRGGVFSQAWGADEGGGASEGCGGGVSRRSRVE